MAKKAASKVAPKKVRQALRAAQQDGSINLDVNYDSIINEIAMENAGLRKDKAILNEQVKQLANLVQQLQGQVDELQGQLEPAEESEAPAEEE